MLHKKKAGISKVVDIKEFTSRGTCPPYFNKWPVCNMCFMKFSYQCGKYMGILKVIIISGTVKICRHNGNIICSILSVIGLTHVNTSYLCYSIWFICGFKVTG